MVLALVPLSVWSQSNDRRRFDSDVFVKGRLIDQEVQRALWHSGRFHASPIIGLRSLGYDSNVFSTEFQEEEDFSASPEVGIQTYVRFSPQWILATNATVNYLYYQDLDQLNGTEWGAQTRLYGIFKEVYFDIGGEYRRDRSRINSEVDERVLSRKQTADLNLVIQPTPRGHLTFTPSFYSFEFDEEFEGLGADLSVLDRDESEGVLQYLHKVNPRFWPFVEASVRRFDFSSPGNLRDDSAIAALYFGARNEFDRRFHYNVKIGQEALRFDLASQIDDDVVSTRTYLAYKVTRRWDVLGGGHQYPVFSLTRDYGYYLSQRLFFGFGYRFKGNVRVGPEFSAGRNDYERPFDFQRVSQLRQDDILSANVGIRFPVGQILEWEIQLGYSERDVNLPGLSDEGITVFSDVTYRFDGQ